MGKVKASTFVDKDLWREIKKYVLSRNRKLIREELMADVENMVKEHVNEIEIYLNLLRQRLSINKFK